MKRKYQVVVIGGGLGGLTTALHLTKSGIDCLVIEKNSYPSHKVCGEYVSNEVVPYLQHLSVDPLASGAKRISKYLISTKTGKTVQGNLSMGGFGISRYCLDNLMFEQLEKIGGAIYQDQVVSVQFTDDHFYITTSKGEEFRSEFVIGAFGKRSNLDKSLDRGFIQKKSHWLAIKAHYKSDFEEDVVALHNFEGGYCGLSKVEDNSVNACYLVTYDSFKKESGIAAFQQNVMTKNPYLNEFFQNSKIAFKEPLSISQVSFSQKNPVEQHILMVGDTAGLIHPLCGNGMAMAIHAGKLVSEKLVRFFQKEINSREELETTYVEEWNSSFSKRLRMGRMLSKVFLNGHLSNIIMSSSQLFPGLVPQIINKTHGETLMPEIA